MIVYTADGRGGWLCDENGEVRLPGSVVDTSMGITANCWPTDARTYSK